MMTNAIIFNPNDEQKLLVAQKSLLEQLNKNKVIYYPLTPLILSFEKIAELSRLPLKDFKNKIIAIKVLKLVATCDGANFFAEIQTNNGSPLILEIPAALTIDKSDAVEYKEFPITLIVNVFKVALVKISNIDGCTGKVFEIQDSQWVKLKAK